MNDDAVLSGDIGFLALGDILQLLGSSSGTGVLRLLSRYSPDPGLVYFVDGNPVDAQHGNLQGLDALYSLFGWLNGTFAFTREVFPARKRIAKSRMGIILEGMKRLDDGHTKIVGPVHTTHGDAGLQAPARPETAVVKGPLVDYMYVVDEEDFFNGEHIVEEGKHGSWMWVILEGVVDIVKETPSGTLPIIRIGDGSFIGSIASFLLQGHIRTATAVAVGNVQLGVLDSQRLAQEYAGMSIEFRTLLNSLDKRCKQLTERVVAARVGHSNTVSPSLGNVLVDPQTLRKGQIHIVKKGQAAVVRHTPTGPAVMCVLNQGDMFGDLPFLQLGQAFDGAAICGTAEVNLVTCEAASVQQEYQRLSATFKNIVDNMTNCMSITASRLGCCINPSTAAEAADPAELTLCDMRMP
jgi:CRP-like cAMP-binding protein